MAKPKKESGIEINEDMDFQRRSWRVQRVGWAGMLLFVIAGFAGVFGSGPLAGVHHGSEGSALQMDYDRFIRLRAPATASFELGEAAILPDSTARIWFDSEWLSAFKVNSITPEPDDSEIVGNRIVHVFRVTSGNSSRIDYDLETQKGGRITGMVGLVNGPSFRVSQLAYP